jgi:hypothetical protein
MNKLLFTFILFLSFVGNAQTYKLIQTDNIHNQLKLNSKTGEVFQIQDDGQSWLIQKAITPNNEKPNKYIIHKTKNLWTYILLDQFSGKLWQCQFSVQGSEYIASWEINPHELSNTESNKFTIQPLTSMYQFYLVNDETSETWKFQWTSKGDDYRWIEKL